MLNPMNALRTTAAITALVLFGVSGAAADTADLQAPETYTWSAEGRMPPIQADSVNAITTLEPGQWVTATSPHAARDRNAVVTDIRGLTDVGGWGADLAGVAPALPRKVIQSTQFIDFESFNDIG
ncbi:MAG: hypothetical protein OXQ28_12730 [Acidobacteriota bacterium]|nr:hypothetical protein [Acidobacteriota bacterium]